MVVAVHVNNPPKPKRGGPTKKNNSHNQQPREPCRHWMKTGYCKYGSTCRFAHPTRPKPIVSPRIEKVRKIIKMAQSFLSIQELQSLSKVGFGFHKAFKVYTVMDVVKGKKKSPLLLGNTNDAVKVIEQDALKRIAASSHRRTDRKLAGRKNKAEWFHPDELNFVHAAVMFYASLRTVLDVLREQSGKNDATALTKNDIKVIEENTMIAQKAGDSSEHYRRPESIGRGPSFNAVLFRPKEISKVKAALREYMSRRRNVLRGFFDKDALGATIFSEHIIPFLTVQDLITTASACKRLHQLSRTFTVQDVLQQRSGMTLARSDRVNLGCEVMKQVIQFGGAWKERPCRIVIDRETRAGYRAKLYHPNELPRIRGIVEEHLVRYGRPTVPTEGKALVSSQNKNQQNQDGEECPVLLSAYFGPGHVDLKARKHRAKYNVTKSVEKLICGHPNKNRLVLEPPPEIRDGQGNIKRGPSTFQWWFTRLFGDPCPNVTKVLMLEMLSHNGTVTTKTIAENTRVHMKLAVARK